MAIGAFAGAAQAAPVSLGTADSFAVLGGSTVTNTGPSVIGGNLGVSAGSSVTGFPPGNVINGLIHVTDGVAAQAASDLVTAYNAAAGESTSATISADPVGTTFAPGVYTAPSSLLISGDVTLDGGGDPNAVFIFQAGSSLIAASGTRILLQNGAQSCNVWWQVGSSATIGSGSAFTGNIMALTSISMVTGATLDGRALARNGAVTLDTNVITKAVCATSGGGSGGGGSTPVGVSPDTTATTPGATTTVTKKTRRNRKHARKLRKRHHPKRQTPKRPGTPPSFTG